MEFVYVLGILMLMIVDHTLQNAFVVFICEVMIDVIKHSFIAKFNDIKPESFSEFLEDLCRQVFFFSILCSRVC